VRGSVFSVLQLPTCICRQLPTYICCLHIYVVAYMYMYTCDIAQTQRRVSVQMNHTFARGEGLR